MKLKKNIGIIVMTFGLLLLIVLIGWYRATNPLQDSGLQTYELPSENGVVLGLENKSHFSVKLMDVTVNGESTTEPVYLGISFDTNSYVAMSPDPDPNIQFMNIVDHPIYTQLTGKDADEAIKRKQHTPIHYGIRIVNNTSKPMKYITIRYKYLGFTKTKTITRWFDTQ